MFRRAKFKLKVKTQERSIFCYFLERGERIIMEKMDETQQCYKTFKIQWKKN